MAIIDIHSNNFYTKSDKYYKTGLDVGITSTAALITATAAARITEQAFPYKDKYDINFGGNFASKGEDFQQQFLRYGDRRYNVVNITSAQNTVPQGDYQVGFVKKLEYYGTAEVQGDRSMNLLETFTVPRKEIFNQHTDGYYDDLIINFKTMKLEDYLNLVPFNTSSSFITNITLKRNSPPAFSQTYLHNVDTFTNMNKEEFIAYCKSTYGEDCRVITGYDISGYQGRNLIQSIDVFANSVSASGYYVDKCSLIPLTGWLASHNVDLADAFDVKNPNATDGYKQYAPWNSELMYSELVHPLSCNATKLAAVTSTGYQRFNNFFPLVFASSDDTFNSLGYGHFFYSFQNEGDFRTYADSSFSAGNLRGYGVIGVWTLEQIKTYAERCLGMAYTIDDIDGDPENPPDDGEPNNPDDDDPGDGDNHDDPVPINPDYTPGYSYATAWLLTNEQVQDLNAWFFGGYLKDWKALASAGMNPYDMMFGLYKYNIRLEALNELTFEEKPFTCGGVEYKDDEDNPINRRYISSSSGIVNLSDGFNITRYFGNFLDFEPYTTMRLYIPYCGELSLPCNVVYGNTLYIKYAIDFYSGECTAFVMANDHEKDFLVDSIKGYVGMKKFFCGQDNSTYMRPLIKGIAGSIFGGVGTLLGLATGGGLGAAAASSISKGSSSLFGSPIENFTKALTTPPQNVVKGEVSESLAAYAPQDCVVYIERTMPALPGDSRTNFNALYNYIGRPASYEATVGSFSGYLSCSEIKGTLNNAIITEEEKNMIYSALRGGIYING